MFDLIMFDVDVYGQVGVMKLEVCFLSGGGVIFFFGQFGVGKISFINMIVGLICLDVG